MEGGKRGKGDKGGKGGKGGKGKDLADLVGGLQAEEVEVAQEVVLHCEELEVELGQRMAPITVVIIVTARPHHLSQCMSYTWR